MYEKLKGIYNNCKLKGKISFIFLTGIFVYLIFFILFLLLFYRMSIREEYIQGQEKAISELAENLDMKIGLINKVSISIIGNNTVRSFLKAEHKTIAMEQQVQTELYQKAFIGDYVESIYLIDLDENFCFINYSGIDATRKNNFDSVWCEKLKEKGGQSVVVMNADSAYYDSSYDVLSLMRAVYDIDSQKLIGYLVINMPVSIITDSFDGFWGNADLYLAAGDNRDNIIAEKGDRRILSVSDGGTKERIPHIVSKGFFSYLFMEKTVGESGVLLTYVSKAGFWKNLPLNLLIFSVAFIVITVVLLLVLNRTMRLVVTNPIAKLVNSMERIKEGRFYRVSMETHNDEIGILKDTYNMMLVKINQLIEELLNEEKEKKVLELAVLQEQIKPHFLYNSLSSIEYLALTGNLQETVSGIETLERFYKNFLSSGLRNITVEQEVTIAEDYLKLQKMRFGSLFDAEFIVDEELAEMCVPKLILQPLVENSLMHGIYPKGEHGKIDVSVRRDRDKMLITVYDDGIGMEREMLQKILEESGEKKNFGLKGTLMRIHYHYGIENFYEISSEPGCFTQIHLWLPISHLETDKDRDIHGGENEKDQSDAGGR